MKREDGKGKIEKGKGKRESAFVLLRAGLRHDRSAFVPLIAGRRCNKE
jgi:hypothetical protein